MRVLYYFLLLILSVCLTSCSVVSSTIVRATTYENDISHEPRCQNLLGKAFLLKKDVYLYHFGGSSHDCIAVGPIWEIVSEKDGSQTKYLGTPSIQLLEMLRKGQMLRVVKITTKGSYVQRYSERVAHIYVEFQSSFGKTAIAQGEDVFAYPYSLLKPDPEFLQPVD